MKKKGFIALGFAAVLAAVIFIPSVQAFAISALTIFRVADLKTIQVTASDIEEFIEFSKNNEDYPAYETAPAFIKEEGTAEPESVKLNAASEFKEFSFNLPKELDGETPSIFARESYVINFALDASSLNAQLSDAGLNPIQENFDGARIGVNIPPIVGAEYEDLILLATQGFYVDAPDGLLDELKQSYLQLPFLSDNLRLQLASIDPKSRDIYLPVLQGFGKETEIGSTTGYIYTLGDLRLAASEISEIAPSIPPSDLQGFEDEVLGYQSVLVWINDGALYALLGNQTDSELSKIARSIR
ncbi:MAG: hypothetical protein LBU32_15275 [Clostridiales bacterium]|jgi:hypothetical protein|nr:hypothetical protein [Clostridiales bacterium]